VHIIAAGETRIAVSKDVQLAAAGANLFNVRFQAVFALYR
jgi:hypothetical protein